MRSIGDKLIESSVAGGLWLQPVLIIWQFSSPIRSRRVRSSFLGRHYLQEGATRDAVAAPSV